MKTFIVFAPNKKDVTLDLGNMQYHLKHLEKYILPEQVGRLFPDILKPFFDENEKPLISEKREGKPLESVENVKTLLSERTEGTLIEDNKPKIVEEQQVKEKQTKKKETKKSKKA